MCVQQDSLRLKVVKQNYLLNYVFGETRKVNQSKEVG